MALAPGSTPAPVPPRPSGPHRPTATRRRLKLRHLLFLALFLAGLVPLALSNWLLIRQNRATLEGQEQVNLVASATALSREIDDSLASMRKQLALTGAALLDRGTDAAGGPGGAAERLGEPWVEELLARVAAENRGQLLALQVLGRDGVGPRIAAQSLPQPAFDALDEAFAAALESGEPVYEFALLPSSGEPLAALAVPVGRAGGETELVVQGLTRLTRLPTLFLEESQNSSEVGLFLIGREGELLWSRGVSREMQAELMASDVVRDFVRRPLNLTRPYTSTGGGDGVREYLVRVSAVEEPRWGVVVQRPLSAAFEFVDRLVLNTLFLSLFLAVASLFFAGFFARRLTRPIQVMAETSHQIAAGNFGRRVESVGLTQELADLAEDFNQMGDHVEGYVARLESAVRANRDLFIGSLRAFAAAIDAKDPYTRGHSERVASLSRSIARHLGLPEETQHKVWIGALLHDVGKIGIDDRILKKGGVLTPEEYEQIQAHPTIGAEILSSIEQLRDMIPAVRWHHEAWNGRGYPDGLRGEAIPLAARIVAVADTFDAITTSRPYQEGYTLDFAVETLSKLAGTRFDAKIVTAFLHAYERGEVLAVRPGKVGYDHSAEARVAEVS